MDIEKALERTNRILIVDNDKIKTQIYVSDLKALLNELDKDNNIISDLQNEVTLKQCELDKKDKIINNAKQWIENTMNDRHIVGCNLGDLQMLLDILESE